MQKLNQKNSWQKYKETWEKEPVSQDCSESATLGGKSWM